MFEVKNVDYQNASHVKYDIKYHIVWITKNNDIGQRLKLLLIQTCQSRGDGDNKRSYSKRPYSYFRVMPAWPDSCKNSPVSQWQEFEDTSRRISALKKTLLGTTIYGQEGIFVQRWEQ